MFYRERPLYTDHIFFQRNSDGTRFIIPLSQPTDAPTPFLRTLTSLLARDHTTYLNPLLSITLLCVADHLTDADTAKLPNVMYEQHDLSPTSPEWLANWENILDNPDLLSQARPLTRAAIMNSLQAVYESVKDMSSYRMPLADLIFTFCQRQVADEKDDSEGIVVWRILGEEVVLRTVDGQDKQDTESSQELGGGGLHYTTHYRCIGQRRRG
jgi:tuberous sclerosis protein 2